MRRRRVAILSAVFVAACGAPGGRGTGGGPQATPSSPPATTAPALWLEEFPAYPGARQLCTGHVTGAPNSPIRSINWTVYATPDEPGAVVLFYAPRPWASTPPGATTLSLTGRGGNRLSVHPVSDSYPGCGTPPGAGDKTVILVSHATPYPS